MAERKTIIQKSLGIFWIVSQSILNYIFCVMVAMVLLIPSLNTALMQQFMNNGAINPALNKKPKKNKERATYIG